MAKMSFKADERAKASRFQEDLVEKGVVPFAHMYQHKGRWVVDYELAPVAA